MFMLWKGTGDNVHFNQHIHHDYLSGWKYLLSSDYRAAIDRAWKRETGFEIGVQITAGVVGMLLSALVAALLAMLLYHSFAP